MSEDLEMESKEVLASKLIDAWCTTDKNGKIPWAKAVQIAAVICGMLDENRDRLLHLGDEDGECPMCGRGELSSYYKTGFKDGVKASIKVVEDRDPAHSGNITALNRLLDKS